MEVWEPLLYEKGHVVYIHSHSAVDLDIGCCKYGK
jgi:hypothetical protein